MLKVAGVGATLGFLGAVGIYFALGLVVALERYANAQWMADHYTDEQQVEIMLDQFKQKVQQKLELLMLKPKINVVLLGAANASCSAPVTPEPFLRRTSVCGHRNSQSCVLLDPVLYYQYLRQFASTGDDVQWPRFFDKVQNAGKTCVSAR